MYKSKIPGLRTTIYNVGDIENEKPYNVGGELMTAIVKDLRGI